MAARLASALLRAAGMVQTTHATLRSLEEAARLLIAGASVPPPRATNSHQPGRLLGGRATGRTQEQSPAPASLANYTKKIYF